PHWGAREQGAPVEGHDIRLKPRTKGSVRVRRSEVLHRGEEVTEPRSCWVDRRGCAHNVKGGHPPLMRGQDRDGRKAGLSGQYGSGSCSEAVRGPTLNLAPVNFHLCEHTLG